MVADARRHSDRHEQAGITDAVLRGPGRWMPRAPSSTMSAVAAGCVGSLATVGIMATLDADGGHRTLRAGGAWAAATLLALPLVGRSHGGWSAEWMRWKRQI